MNLAGLETLTIEEIGKRPAQTLSSVVDGVNIFLPLAGMVDLEEEIARIEKDLAEARRELERAQSKLANEGFITKAPPQVVDKEREKVKSYQATVDRLQNLLQEMQG